MADLITMADEAVETQHGITLFDPIETWKECTYVNCTARCLSTLIYDHGQRVYTSPSLNDIRKFCKAQINTLWDEVKRFENPPPLLCGPEPEALGYQKRTAQKAVEVKISGFPLGEQPLQAADEAGLPIPSVSGRRGNAAPHPSAGRPQTPSPKREGVLPKNFHHPYKTVTTRAPCTYCGHTACAGGFYVGAAFIVFLGGGAYAALELAWRALPTGRCSQRAGPASAFCKSWLLHRCRWPGPPPWAQPASAGWSWRWGAVCRSLLHTEVWDYTAEWGNVAGLICPRYSFTGFLLCGWVIFVLRGVESTVYHPQNSLSDS